MIQWASLIMVVQGVISKFGAIFIMVPDPVVGGLFCVMFGMITAFGMCSVNNIIHFSLFYANVINSAVLCSQNYKFTYFCLHFA